AQVGAVQAFLVSVDVDEEGRLLLTRQPDMQLERRHGEDRVTPLVARGIPQAVVAVDAGDGCLSGGSALVEVEAQEDQLRGGVPAKRKHAQGPDNDGRLIAAVAADLRERAG